MTKKTEAKKDAPEVDKKKQQAVELAISQIEKQFGKGSIMRLGEETGPKVFPSISTGSPALDIALGIGGIPRGRVTEIYGPEAQKNNGTAAFIDAEHALDIQYAEKLGVNVSELLLSQPDTGEQALEIADMLIRSNAVDLIVIDSVAALVPKAELEGDMGDAHMGLQARLMSQALRKLTATISKSKTSLIFINQIRHKIGVFFGNPETTTGGNALKFYSSVRMDIRRIGQIKKADAIIGNRVRVKVVKNKMAPPFKEAQFDLLFNEGISRNGDILDMAVEADIVEKSGSWFSYGEERIGQGRASVIELMKERPEMTKEIEEKLYQHFEIKKNEV
jgi:recombination protein RecA